QLFILLRELVLRGLECGDRGGQLRDQRMTGRHIRRQRGSRILHALLMVTPRQKVPFSRRIILSPPCSGATRNACAWARRAARRRGARPTRWRPAAIALFPAHAAAPRNCPAPSASQKWLYRRDPTIRS